VVGITTTEAVKFTQNMDHINAVRRPGS